MPLAWLDPRSSCRFSSRRDESNVNMKKTAGWWLGHPSEKYEFVNWDDEIPNIWENKKCSKPPTRNLDSLDWFEHVQESLIYLLGTSKRFCRSCSLKKECIDRRCQLQRTRNPDIMSVASFHGPQTPRNPLWGTNQPTP